MVTKSNEKYSLSRLADRNLAHHVLESPGVYSLGSKPTLPTQFYISIFPVTSWIGADTRNWSTKPTSKRLSASCKKTPRKRMRVSLEFSFWLSTRQHGTFRLLPFHQLVPFLMDGITRSASATVVLELGSGISGRSVRSAGSGLLARCGLGTSARHMDLGFR